MIISGIIPGVCPSRIRFGGNTPILDKDIPGRQQVGEDSAQCLLLTLQRAGLLSVSHVQAALDFGAGLGGPTRALEAFLSPNALLMALEQNQKLAKVSRAALSRATVQEEEGLAYLRRTGQRFDLITAFMPDSFLEMTEFIPLALSRLNPGGKLLVCAIGSADRVTAACRAKGFAYKAVSGAWDFWYGICRNAILISR